MKHIGIFKPDTLINILNCVGVPLVVIYIFCMFIFPWIEAKGSWSLVQGVWDSWQSVNVGVLAFLSSIIAFNISRFNANKQREREFVAARAFLPQALSELSEYLKLGAIVLIESWHKLEDPSIRKRTPLEAKVPNLPEGYQEIFSKCIRFADPDIGEYLAYILVRLQIHHSRLKSFSEMFGQNGSMLPLRANAVSYLYYLGELQALINNLFEFARGTASFSAKSLVWEDYRNAYANLDVRADEIDDLIDWTQTAIGMKQFGSK